MHTDSIPPDCVHCDDTGRRIDNGKACDHKHRFKPSPWDKGAKPWWG
jgi:hypothetical protein